MNILLVHQTNKVSQKLGDLKKRRIFFGRQEKTVKRNETGSLNQAMSMGTIVDLDSEIYVELPRSDDYTRQPQSPSSVTQTPTSRVRIRHAIAKAVSPVEISDDFPVRITESEDNIEVLVEATRSSSQTSSQSLSYHDKTKGKEVATIVKDPDDVSVFIVHQYFDGEIITSKPSVVEDSSDAASLTTGTSSGHPTVTSPDGQFSLLNELENGYIPSEIKSEDHMVDNSLLDDDSDISAISIDRELKFQGMKVDELVCDAVVAPEDKRKRTSLAKLRMIQNKHSVRCGRRVRICETKVAEDDDDSTFATLDGVEWDDEIGAGFCSGETVYDLLGTPEDYPLTRHLISTCDGQNEDEVE